VQLAPAVNVALQVFNSKNEVGLVPPNVIESSSKTAVPEFVSVSAWMAEEDPTFVVAKVSPVALNFSTGTAVPVPVSVTC
jgi:hypothetical protein